MAIVMAAVFGTAFAQEHPDFLFEHSMPEFGLNYKDYYVYSTLETDDGGCLLAVCSGEAESWFLDGFEYDNIPPMVFRVSPLGEMEGQLTLMEDAPAVIDMLFEAPDDPNCVLAVGKTRDLEQEYDKIFVARFDQWLNLQWLREVELPDEYKKLTYKARTFMDSTGDIVYCVVPFVAEPNGGIPPIGVYHRLYLRISPSGELEAIGEYPETCDLLFGAQGEMFEFQDGSGDYGHIVEEYEEEGNNDDMPYLIRTDRDFTAFARTSLPTTISLPIENDFIVYYRAAAQAFPNNTIIIAAEDGYGWWDANYNYGWGFAIAVMKYDSDGNLLGMTHTASEGDVNYDEESQRELACNKAMDVCEDHLYFCYGVYDRYFGSTGLTCPNGFVVVKTDMDANIVWQRYYHDGRLIQPFTMQATSDGSCLVAGRNYGLDYVDPKIFAVKIFPDGTLANPELEAFVRPYAYWPNPAQDELHLQYSPDVTPTQIELYNLQGKLVKTQRNGLESLNMEGLSAGTYTMRVTMEDGKVFSDKVVKE